MKLLVFGRTGQLGRAIRAQAATAPGLALTALGRDAADLARPEVCAAAICDAAPDAVINAAAFTDVDGAEDDPARAHRINAEAPGAMARACAARRIPFVHVSTDYVFDGSGTAPHAPDTPTAPLNTYGRSKSAGEDAVRAAGGPHAILRTAWVFSAHGQNFVTTMLNLAARHHGLRIVADQVGGPTPADALAAACIATARQLAADPGKSGTYHYAGTPEVSRADFARAIFAQAALDCAVTGIPTDQYPTPAPRPLNSRLDCTATETAFRIARPDWHAALDDIISRIPDSTE
ncbi:dTDP-4-dehydrorhamnose reductase [Roseovarius sp. TE539]|uniref:dTDP-4-dehydrorhamnose reductase n=1 Tax=Roseovarius sp. TE539 TaxID=2249812 RepID=UPI000DE17C25|nr:dTDP-4-dehydrorhamnose reductase [Roseovarius sp. TE539]RBI76881.1 dTDP-4-dehydrorhamnose reductase [Roseovarius sp. TE539]